MSFVDSLKTYFNMQKAKRWPEDARKALLALIYEVVVADGIISANELAAVEKAAEDFGVPFSSVKDLGLGWALGELKKDDKKLKIAALLVAPVFFADDDLDKSEQAFLEKLRANFPDDALQNAVMAVRQKKLDETLQRLHDEAFAEGNAPRDTTPSKDTAHTATE